MATATKPSGVPLKADLLKAQRKWKRVLQKVIHEGKIQPITDGGKTVAYIVPIDLYKRMNGVP